MRLSVPPMEDRQGDEEYFLSSLISTIEQTDSQRKSSQAFKPSSLNCSRRSYYQLSGAEQDPRVPSYALTGIVEVGSYRHEALQTWINRMTAKGFDVEYMDIEAYLKLKPNPELEVVEKQGMETKLYNKNLNMSFMMDGIIKVRGKYYILEIKTTAQQKFARITNVLPEHRDQATAYFLNFALPVIFLYEDRNFLEKKTILFKPSQKDIDNLKKTMDEANKGIEYGLLPSVPVNILTSIQDQTVVSKKSIKEGTWQMKAKECRYCEYKSRCMKNEK